MSQFCRRTGVGGKDMTEVVSEREKVFMSPVRKNKNYYSNFYHEYLIQTTSVLMKLAYSCSGKISFIGVRYKGGNMDQLTRYLVYNKTPRCRNDMDYNALAAQKEVRATVGDIDKRILQLSPDMGRNYERVLYARSKLVNGARPAVVGGTPISEALAIDLRVTAFSSASCPPRGEWIRTPLIMRPPDQPLAYGLAAPRNGARSLLSALQAHMIKWLLFDSRPQTKDNKSEVPPETYLRPSEERQEEALWRACSEVIWRCAGGFTHQAGVEPKAIVGLPSEEIYVQHSSSYYQDGITEKAAKLWNSLPESIFPSGYNLGIFKLRVNRYLQGLIHTLFCFKLHIFEFKSLEDLQIFLKRYLYLFQTEDGSGALLVLYAAMLSRGCENVKKDLDGKLTHLVSAHVEGSLNVVTLLLTGRATPYLHNGVLYVGDEDHYAMPQFGVLARSPVGLLVWYGGEENSKNNINKQFPGSRLKTPALPIWVTSCSGHFGILFNTNRELLRNYHAERRFDIQYYTCGGCHVVLSVDTRAHDDGAGHRSDDISATPLEKLIHTKWQDAKITWTGSTPYVGETPK